MEIQEIKQRLTISQVLQHYNLKPDRNNMLKCPFHADDTASMKIYPQTNTFNCFGCGKNGDQIEFCTLKEGDKHKGLLKATELTGLSAETKVKTEDIQPINNKPKQPDNHPKENHTEILTRIFESFRNGLQKNGGRNTPR
jgi:DNA primase